MALTRKISAFIQLIRPELPLAAGLCVLLGQAVALGGFPPFSTMLLGFLLGFLLSSSAMVFNDYFDLEVDRVNAPQRPYAAGKLTTAEVIVFGLLTALLGLLTAAAIRPLVLGLSLLTWILGFGYNWRFKSAGLWGNLCVSISVAMTFILGGLSVGQTPNAILWVFIAVVFFFDLGEEIAGDSMDMAGDEKRGVRSLALRVGKAAALRVSAALFGLVVVLSLIPIFTGSVGWAYAVPMGIADVFILFFTYRLMRAPNRQAGHNAMRALYLTATAGLGLAILGHYLL